MKPRLKQDELKAKLTVTSTLKIEKYFKKAQVTIQPDRQEKNIKHLTGATVPVRPLLGAYVIRTTVPDQTTGPSLCAQDQNTGVPHKQAILSLIV